MSEQTPANQEPKLIFGKYKTIEEAEADLKETKRQNEKLNESLAREQRLNYVLENVEPPAAAAPTTDDLGIEFKTPEDKQKFQSYLASEKQAIYQTVGKMVESSISSTEKQKAAESKFYTVNKDLGDFKIEVEHFASEVAREFGPRAKTVPQDDLFSEVAKRTRTYLTEHKKKLTKTPLHLEGGSMQEPNETSPAPVSSASEEDRLKDYFDKEVPEMKKKQNQPLRGVA